MDKPSSYRDRLGDTYAVLDSIVSKARDAGEDDETIVAKLAAVIVKRPGVAAALREIMDSEPGSSVAKAMHRPASQPLRKSVNKSETLLLDRGTLRESGTRDDETYVAKTVRLPKGRRSLTLSPTTKEKT